MTVADRLLRTLETPDADDRNLVGRCIGGEQEAWKQLVSRYQCLIYSLALRSCRDSDAAADILQQVCLELYQRLDEVRNIASLPSWIATVTQRKSFDYMKALKPVESLVEEIQVDSDAIFGSIERQHALDRAMAILPERNRRLIQMMYMSGGGHSYEEISAALGIPVASIGPTRIRSLKKLKKVLS
jgi:RNA polymerase sigma factor (sigma-70 family)